MKPFRRAVRASKVLIETGDGFTRRMTNLARKRQKLHIGLLRVALLRAREPEVLPDVHPLFFLLSAVIELCSLCTHRMQHSQLQNTKLFASRFSFVFLERSILLFIHLSDPFR